MNKEDNKVTNKFYIFILITMIIVIVAASYAIFSYSRKSNSLSSITTGTLKLDINTSSDLSLLSKYPMSDSSINSYSAFTFDVENTGSQSAKYKLFIIDDDEKYEEDGCSNNKMPWTSLKYQLKKNNEVVEQGNIEEDGVLYSTTLASNSTDDYELKIYISSAAGNEVAGKHFHVKVKLKAIVEGKTNFDTGE